MNAPPLTSHVPIMTQQSPGKFRGENNFMDNSNRTNHMLGMPLLMTSFNKNLAANLLTGDAHMSSQLTDNRCGNEEEVVENGKV